MLPQHWKMRTNILYLGGNCFSMAVRSKTACQPSPRGLLSICFRLDFLRLGFFSFLDPMTCCCFYVLQGRQQSTSGCFNDMISHHTKPPPLWPPTETCWLHLSIRCRCVCVCLSVSLTVCVYGWRCVCVCVCLKSSKGNTLLVMVAACPEGSFCSECPGKNQKERKKKRQGGVLQLWCEIYPYLCEQKKLNTCWLKLANTFLLIILVIHW